MARTAHGLPGIYNLSDFTLATGEGSALATDANGHLLVNLTGTTIDVGVADLSTFTPGTTIEQPVGGLYQTTPSTLTNNQTGAFAMDTRRNLKVTLMDPNAITQTFPTTAAAADAYANPTITQIGADLMGFNGTSWDRVRSGAQANVAAATGFISSAPVGIYNSSAPTITNTRFNSLQIDVNSNLQVNSATLIAGENQTDNRMMVENSWSYTAITTQTTTTVKSAAGKLGCIIIPTPVANATVKVYDNTAGSGSVLLDTITFPAALLSSGPIQLFVGGVAFGTGLTIVTAGATMSLGVYWL